MPLPVPSPRTFNVQEYETAAYLNAVRDALIFLLNPPRARVTQATTATSVAQNAFVSIGMDNTVVDTYSGHSNTTNNSRYTAQVAGRYRVIGVNAFVANTSGVRLVREAVNGTGVPGSLTSMNATSSLAAAQATEATVFLNVGDFVETQGFQTTSGALNTSPGTSDTAPALDAQWVATS